MFFLFSYSLFSHLYAIPPNFAVSLSELVTSDYFVPNLICFENVCHTYNQMSVYTVYSLIYLCMGNEGLSSYIDKYLINRLFENQRF